ncbi:MAG: GNAT family N-acetyltransferase [Anaerolineales bacterium]
MNAQVLTLSKTKTSPLRAFDIRRDLLPVADLVELCFAESLDADGRLYIRQMRQAAQGPLMDLAKYGSGRDLPMSGFVWQEYGSLVGNLSLVPHRHGNRRFYLIANVAVHPDHRRRGIARALTQAALADVERRGRYETWLQTDEKNVAAVDLYRGMGFVEKAKRTSWRVRPTIELAEELAGQDMLRPRHPADWPAQLSWLKSNYSEEVRWQLPLDLKLFQPGWRGALERALSERRVKQWSALHAGELLGVMSWQSSALDADRLWLATDAYHEDKAIPLLMQQARAELQPERRLALNYPGGQAQKALAAAGFHAVRTLIWMAYPWSSTN